MVEAAMIDQYKALIHELVNESQDELFMKQIYTILIRRHRKMASCINADQSQMQETQQHTRSGCRAIVTRSGDKVKEEK